MNILTMRDVKDELETPLRNAILQWQYADYGSQLAKIRARLKAQLSRTCRTQKSLWLHLHVFDLLCLGFPNVKITSRLRISHQRVTEIIEFLFHSPALVEFKGEVRANLYHRFANRGVLVRKSKCYVE